MALQPSLPPAPPPPMGTAPRGMPPKGPPGPPPPAGAVPPPLMKAPAGPGTPPGMPGEERPWVASDNLTRLWSACLHS